MMNVLLIIGFIILIVVLVNTFGSMSEGVIAPVILSAAIMSIYVSYKENVNADWLNIGASAAKAFVVGIVVCLILGIVVYYTFYIKEETSEWIVKCRNK